MGFVLPCDEEGLPISSRFLVTSFQKSFEEGDIAKYAFVYTAQPLTDGVEAFCLACLGISNKFTSDLLIKQWKYIFTDCKKRGISVVIFAADGDSVGNLKLCRYLQFSFSSQTSAINTILYIHYMSFYDLVFCA